MKLIQRQIPFFILLFILSITFLSCGINSQIAKEDIPLATYASARAAFNTHLEDYLNYRDMIPRGPQRDAIRSKYEGKFNEANKALDLWGVVVKSGGTSSDAAEAYSKLIDFLVMELIKDKIVKVE